MFAAESFRADREVVLTAVTAVKAGRGVISWAADELLEDSSFAKEAKKNVHLFRLTLLSGRHTVVLAYSQSRLEDVLEIACHRLGIPMEGAFLLLDFEPPLFVKDWPGIKPTGEITDYQLMVSSQQR
eukprot:4976966-Amphidinium_carterae.1